jgi:phenylacetate-CoA ligase
MCVQLGRERADTLSPLSAENRHRRLGDATGSGALTNVREILLGPSYFYHRRLIERSKLWSAKEIAEYQAARFQPLVNRYGDGVRTKDDYRRDPARFTRYNLPLLTHTVRTGGTSGQPLRFSADTFARRQKERAYLFDIWSRIGYSPYDLRVRYGGDIHDDDMLQFNRLENVWSISPKATVESRLDELRSWIGTVPPFFLHIYPSSLYTFIELVGEKLFRSLPVRGIIAASEAFPAGQQLQFEADFGLRIAHWYGHSEYAVLAYYCRDCLGFHFYPTYGQLELLPSDTDGCERVVATSFNWIGTQFVRYETEDLAVSGEGKCATSNFPRVDAIMGRSQETFIDNLGRRRSLFGYVFGDLDHGTFWDQIQDLQFIQTAAGRLLVRLVISPGVDKNSVERTFADRIPMASLEFEYVANIERSQNGKRRYFMDLTTASPQEGL